MLENDYYIRSYHWNVSCRYFPQSERHFTDVEFIWHLLDKWNVSLSRSKLWFWFSVKFSFFQLLLYHTGIYHTTVALKNSEEEAVLKQIISSWRFRFCWHCSAGQMSSLYSSIELRHNPEVVALYWSISILCFCYFFSIGKHYTFAPHGLNY